MSLNIQIDENSAICKSSLDELSPNVRLAMEWWVDLPLHDIMGEHGWINLTDKYFFGKSCYEVTGNDVYFIWENEFLQPDIKKI